MNRTGWIGLVGGLMLVVSLVNFGLYSPYYLKLLGIDYWVGVSLVLIIGMVLLGYSAVQSLRGKK